MIVKLNNESMEVSDGITLADFLIIADRKLQLGDRGMCALNGVLCAERNVPLKDNDTVIYVPVLEGG